MGLLDRFESRLESAVEGTASKMFKGSVEPVEVAATLQREATAKRAVLGINRVVAPNLYTVSLSSDDYERLAPYAETLTGELQDTLVEYLVLEGWATYGQVEVELRLDETLGTGIFRVSSSAVPTKADQAPMVPGRPKTASAAPGRPQLIVEATGQTFSVPVGTLVLGRGASPDVDLLDNSVSRRHAEVRFDGEDASVTDLGSTNGTMVNGSRVGRGEQARMSDGDILRLGGVTLAFRQEGR